MVLYAKRKYMADKKPRGRARLFEGSDRWLVATLARVIANLKPGERLDRLEIGKFVTPPDKVYIQVRTGPEQENTIKILLENDQNDNKAD